MNKYAPFSSIAMPCEQSIIHTDVISGNDVQMSSFVDAQTGISIALDASWLEQTDDTFIAHPVIDNAKLFLFSGKSDDTIIDEGTLSTALTNLLFIVCMYQYFDDNESDYHSVTYHDEKYWRNNDILINWISSSAERLLGIDTDGLNSNAWTGLFTHATDRERVDTIKTLILHVLSPVLAGRKAFIVLPETPYLDETCENITRGVDTEALDAQIWFSETMTEESGWSPSEAEEINALTPGQGKLLYGDFYHTLFLLNEEGDDV